jgi:holo-[acyl-carrier protein] synthase
MAMATLAVRCGTDLVEIERIRDAVTRLGQPFLDRIWTAGEQSDCLPGVSLPGRLPSIFPDGPLTHKAAASLAVRFAAKEAAAKAMGTGIGRLGIGWTDLVVVRDAAGAPSMRLEGPARTVFARLGGQSLAISLSHERHLALAFCVLTCVVEGSRP